MYEKNISASKRRIFELKAPWGSNTHLLPHSLLLHLEGDGGNVLLDVAEGDRLLQLLSQVPQLRPEIKNEDFMAVAFSFSVNTSGKER
jgi:hypothetical protein